MTFIWIVHTVYLDTDPHFLVLGGVYESQGSLNKRDSSQNAERWLVMWDASCLSLVHTSGCYSGAWQCKSVYTWLLVALLTKEEKKTTAHGICAVRLCVMTSHLQLCGDDTWARLTPVLTSSQKGLINFNFIWQLMLPDGIYPVLGDVRLSPFSMLSCQRLFVRLSQLSLFVINPFVQIN